MSTQHITDQPERPANPPAAEDAAALVTAIKSVDFWGREPIARDLLRRIGCPIVAFDQRGRLWCWTRRHKRWFRVRSNVNGYWWLLECGVPVRDLGRVVGYRRLSGALRRAVEILRCVEILRRGEADRQRRMRRAAK